MPIPGHSTPPCLRTLNSVGPSFARSTPSSPFSCSSPSPSPPSSSSFAPSLFSSFPPPGGLALYIVLLIAPLISTYIPSPLVNLLFLINKCFLSSSSFFFFYYPYDCKRIFGLLPKINVLLYNIIILSSSSSFF